MVARRTVALGLLGLGVLLAASFLAVAPRIHGFEHTCEREFSADRLAGDGWFAIRGAQISDAAPQYNASDGTTTIVPGCSHGDAGIAIRVRGDHTGFTRADDRLIVSGHGVTGATTPSQVAGGDGQPLALLEGEFRARPLWPHALLWAGALAAGAAGAGLMRPAHARAAWAMPLAALLGSALAHWAWSTDAGFGIFLVLAPLLGLIPGAVGLAGTGASWRRAGWWAWAALLAYAIAWWATFLAFGGAYPLTPDA